MGGGADGGRRRRDGRQARAAASPDPRIANSRRKDRLPDFSLHKAPLRRPDDPRAAALAVGPPRSTPTPPGGAGSTPSERAAASESNSARRPRVAQNRPDARGVASAASSPSVAPSPLLATLHRSVSEAPPFSLRCAHAKRTSRPRKPVRGRRPFPSGRGRPRANLLRRGLPDALHTDAKNLDARQVRSAGRGDSTGARPCPRGEGPGGSEHGGRGARPHPGGDGGGGPRRGLRRSPTGRGLGASRADVGDGLWASNVAR